MKAKILKKFKDKNTGRIYIPGEVVDFTEQRVEEILKKTELIEVQEEEVAPEETIEEVQGETKGEKTEEEKTEVEVPTKEKRSKKEEQ